MVNTSRESTDYEPLGDDSFQNLIYSNESDDDTTSRIYGYKQSAYSSFIYHFVAILFLGIPYIVYSWYPQLQILKYKRCHLKDADIIFLQDNNSNSVILKIQIDFVNFGGQNVELRYFMHQHVKFFWKNDDVQFTTLPLSYANVTLKDLTENNLGLTHGQQNNAIKVYGTNNITIEVKTYFELFIQEVFNPFYLFQIFSITLWTCDEYYIYAGCILFLSIVSIATSLKETKKQSQALHDLIESSNCKQCVVHRPRENHTYDEHAEIETEVVDAASLVPDDIIVLPASGCIMPCDVVLLTGLCIVNEAMLTGESVPVTKTPPTIGDEFYNIDLHKRHTIFAGTQVIQTRFYGGSKVIAKVIRTGFNTSKGELIKSILYPKPVGLQFYRDSMKFVFCLAIIAIIGMIYCVYIYTERKAELKEIFIRALDIITIVVPPALPAAMTLGTIYSQNRLKKRGIYCISPPRINVCGKLKLICFDKTGTLTQDGLEFYGVLPSNNGNFNHLNQEPYLLEQNEKLIQAMATCHSLTRIDNNLTGDPLDIGMFEATKWELQEPGTENTRYDMLAPTVVKPHKTIQSYQTPEEELLEFQIGILRQFSFSSSQQCMSVICRLLGARNMIVFTKGAPEKIQAMCVEKSLPDNFSNLLSSYTMSGYRVIALAYKELNRKLTWRDAMKMKRDVIECDLKFLGFMIMQNALKPETTPIIKELHAAKIRTVMVTGDNIMTAISVSRDCGMVLPNENIVLLSESADIINGEIMPKISVEILGSTPQHHQQNGDCILNMQHSSNLHIALDGKTWNILRNYYSDLIPRIVLHGTIFARFRPEQKTQLVQSLQELDYVVGMCGDGANDCGALKAANIGVSLSQAEASVAAPFTSSAQNISCIKHLISEGRCALVTSFSVFKYMAMYSLIQFFTILILYKRYTTLGNMQFLYIDLIITTSLAIGMSCQGPADILVAKRPMGSLVSLVNLIPLLLQVILCGIVQYGALYYLSLQSWFNPLKIESYVDEEVIICWENTVVFSVSCYQYIILACVYSKGRPYRETIFSNGYLLLTSVILTVFTTVLLVYPFHPLAKYFDMIPVTKSYHKFLFRTKILLFPLAHLLTAVCIEVLIGERKYLKCIVHFLTRKRVAKNKYKQIGKTDINQWLDICSSNSSQSSYC